MVIRVLDCIDARGSFTRHRVGYLIRRSAGRSTRAFLRIGSIVSLAVLLGCSAREADRALAGDSAGPSVNGPSDGRSTAGASGEAGRSQSGVNSTGSADASAAPRDADGLSPDSGAGDGPAVSASDGGGGADGSAETRHANTVVSVNASGAYAVTFTNPAWTFSGNLGSAATSIARTAGSDALGAYVETVFTYTSGATRQGRIRAYDALPVVVFGEKSTTAAANTRNFPRLSTLPTTPHHLTYSDLPFGEYTLTGLTADSPWVFFDDASNAFVLSAASHFMNVETRQEAGGAISSGIATEIASLPAGFEQSTILVAEPGINRAYETWGTALLQYGGKSKIASDSTPDLARFGYWTDHGGTYYYLTEAGVDYPTTLKDVRTYFDRRLALPIGYVQLDSWWYPKGATATWQGNGTSQRGGAYRFEADTTLFPSGLAGFQQSLGLPLMVHARWIDPASPYRAMYKMSNNVSTDPAFWTMVAAYLKSSGVVTFEQDWLYRDALPLTSNLVDQDAFLDNMAKAMADVGINMQYCMPLPKHYLQSTKYQNLVTTRVSNDRFNRNRWKVFLYGSRLASALGVWPWSDVFQSGERDNLLLAALSGGMVGVGDAIGGANKVSIARAVRSDGVLIKPDAPMVQLDRTMVAEARGVASPSIATTFSQHPGGKASYVFAFTDRGATTVSFTPAELGHTGTVYVLDVNKATGRTLASTMPYSDALADTAYYVIVPIGPSGIGFLGEQGKIAPLGKKRIASWSDDGTVTATVLFAAGEPPITLMGTAPSAPTVTATGGMVDALVYDPATKRFTFSLSSSAPTATIQLKL